jgi:hypothetical protein
MRGRRWLTPIYVNPPIFGNPRDRESRPLHLTIYCRHVKKCAHRSEGRRYRRCPICIDGFVGREEIRESLKTRVWEEAQQKAREWEAEGTEPKPAEAADYGLPIEAAFDQYLGDAESRQLGPAALYKRRLLKRQMVTFATDRGVRYLEEFDLKLLSEFRATWNNRNLSAKKKLEQLRGFFCFWVRCGVLTGNPTLELDAPIVKQPPLCRSNGAKSLTSCTLAITSTPIITGAWASQTPSALRPLSCCYATAGSASETP